MLIRKVFGVAVFATASVAAFAFHPYSTSVYLNEVSGNENNLTLIDTGNIEQIGFDSLRLVLKPTNASPAYYYEPFTGLSKMYIQDPTGSDSVLRSFFCVELERDLNDAETSYRKYDATGKIGWLVNQINATNSIDAVQMAGLQLAIWEVAYDGTNGNSYDLSDGIFRTDALFDGFDDQALAKASAENWLTMLSENGADSYYWYYHNPADRTDKRDWQDLVSPAPEPSTLAAIALGAACLIRRRKKA